ncbi:MAG: ABC transporter ATP-binding protein [Lysobacterales bacterium]|jgi:putative ABC transport system ATP-binding protein
MALVELHGVSRIYGGVIGALDDVSMSVSGGEMVALLGPSGSGKSTLLSVIAGFENPSSGSVLVAGKPVGSWRPEEFRQDIVGFLFQQFFLLDHLSAVRNVELALFPTCRKARQRYRIASELLTEVGLANRLHSRTALLSGGERQRVAFCRSIANQPRLLLADEPTGNLDKASGRKLLTILAGYMQEKQGTLIVATHDDEVAAICQRTIRLEDGRVVAE